VDWKGKFLGAAIIDIYWFLTAAPSHAFPVLDFSIPCLGVGLRANRVFKRDTQTAHRLTVHFSLSDSRNSLNQEA
jgi:hypothetical protein